MLRVLLVDDREGGRATALAGLRSAAGIVPVGSATADSSLWLELQHSRPNVVVMDYEQPSSEKLVLCHRIKHAVLPLAVVINAASSDAEVAAPALLAGADAVVSTGSAPRQLAESVRRVGRGERLFPPGTAEALTSACRHLDEDDAALVALLLKQARVGDIAAATGVSLDEAASSVERLIHHVTTDFTVRAQLSA